jgi:hypothetical protein
LARSALVSLEGQLVAAAQSLVDRLKHRRPRIVFLEVVRNDAGDVEGMRPEYEETN